MSDDPKKPSDRIQFRKDKDEKENRIQFRKGDDLRNITDKDNTGLRFDPPDKTQNPARNLAPGGQMGNRSFAKTPSNQQEPIIIEFTPEDSEPDPDIDLSNDGTLVSGEFADGTEFLVKSEFDPDINDGQGHMTRLTLIEDGEAAVHFDGSWPVTMQSIPRPSVMRFCEVWYGPKNNCFLQAKIVQCSSIHKVTTSPSKRRKLVRPSHGT